MRADQPLDAVAITRLGTAYTRSRILQSAVEVGVFDHLAAGPSTLAGLRDALGLHPRLSRDFLGALVALGLVERDGDRYVNSAAATAHLVPGGDVYLGARLRTAARRHYPMWGGLTEALRDGEPKAEVGGPGAFERLYRDPDRAREFLAHMDANNGLVAPQLARHVDWSGYRSFVDVGGARGNVAAQLVLARPHLRGAVFELPPIEPFFDELMAELGTTGSVEFHGGDFFRDPLPETDLVVFGHVLHDWSVDRRQELLAAAYKAVPDGGAVLVYDQMLDETAPDLDSLIGSLNVALITEGGSEYTVAECTAWVREAGFLPVGTTRLPVGNDTVLVAVRGS